MKGDEIVQPCDRHSNETVTLRIHVNKYFSEFLRIFENRGIKIVRVNSIRITHKSIYFNFVRCTVLGVRCDVDIFKLTTSAQFINKEVYGMYKLEISINIQISLLIIFVIWFKIKPTINK